MPEIYAQLKHGDIFVFVGRREHYLRLNVYDLEIDEETLWESDGCQPDAAVMKIGELPNFQ